MLQQKLRVLYGYVPKTDKIKVDSTGTGDLSEMSEEMSDGRVNYGFIRYNVNGTWKVLSPVFFFPPLIFSIYSSCTSLGAAMV